MIEKSKKYVLSILQWCIENCKFTVEEEKLVGWCFGGYNIENFKRLYEMISQASNFELENIFEYCEKFEVKLGDYDDRIIVDLHSGAEQNEYKVLILKEKLN